jgi:simple sugar transport system ATP-binding protein
VGILFIGEDLDIILKLCDRVMVLSSGKVTGILPTENATKEKIGYLMSDEIPEEEMLI